MPWKHRDVLNGNECRLWAGQGWYAHERTWGVKEELGLSQRIDVINDMSRNDDTRTIIHAVGWSGWCLMSGNVTRKWAYDQRYLPKRNWHAMVTLHIPQRRGGPLYEYGMWWYVHIKIQKTMSNVTSFNGKDNPTMVWDQRDLHTGD